MKKERSGLITTIGAIATMLFLVTIAFSFIKGVVVEQNFACILWCLIIAIVIIASFIYKRTASGKEFFETFNAPEKQRKKEEKDKKKLAVERAIYSNTYSKKPIKLDEQQRTVYDMAFSDAYDKLVGMGAKNVSTLENMSTEELYTLWFINKTSGPLRVFLDDGSEMIVDVILDGNNAVIHESVEIMLAPYKKSYPEQKPIKKRKVNKKAIKKQRRAHRIAMENKKAQKEKRAEADAKRRANKKRQPPNYEYFAKEWVSQNIGYVNKMLAGATICGEKYANAFIPNNKLPADTTTQQLVVKKLKDDGVICRYDIEPGGISIRAKTKYA